MDKGKIQVYTGNGKGKTTAAIGLAVRSLGAGHRVLFIQFMKSLAYSEQKILKNFENLKLDTVGKPFFIAPEGSMDEESKKKFEKTCVVFPPGQPPKEYVELISQGMNRAAFGLSSGDYDLVVLDEINVAMYFGLVSSKEVIKMLQQRAEGTEVVLTGRGAPEEIQEIADLVTEMKEVKHYYNTEKLEARIGIEY